MLEKQARRLDPREGEDWRRKVTPPASAPAGKKNWRGKQAGGRHCRQTSARRSELFGRSRSAECQWQRSQQRTTQTHIMAKRKSQKDPEDLPDAPDGRVKRKNDESDSDEVRGLPMPPSSAR